MESKLVLLNLRKRHELTQEEMADTFHVTRQAVSRWETGETTPGLDTLKLISREFNVSINTLLGSPQRLICQCCGMPLEDENISREADGSFNEGYCKWCYTDGEFVYKSLEELMSFLVPHMAKVHHKGEDEIREMLQGQLPYLDRWCK